MILLNALGRDRESSFLWSVHDMNEENEILPEHASCGVGCGRHRLAASVPYTLRPSTAHVSPLRSCLGICQPGVLCLRCLLVIVRYVPCGALSK